jgi:hypothetical protein
MAEDRDEPPRRHPRFLKRRARSLALGALILAASALAGAADWIVDVNGPADFTRIQDAVNAFFVQPGDTILVRPGLYFETLYLGSKDLVIRSEAGPFATILDAQEMGSAVSLIGRTSATRIEGLTIRNGRDETGGGVYIYGGGPVLTRNVITGNSAAGGFLGYGYGGGIEVYGSAAIITRNVIQGNTALDGGGGIDVYYSGPSTPGTCCPLIAQNTIVGNRVTAPTGIGGGILVAASEPRVASCVLSGNAAAAGGGLYVDKITGIADAPDAATNIFYSNTPGDADSNGSFHLTASNRHADPRLGPGSWMVWWPRSDSPALDAAEMGLPAGADLTGFPAAADSDLDGAAAADIGAVENRGEITGLLLASDPGWTGGAILTWDMSINPAVVFNVYASDGDPFRFGDGFCLAAGLQAPTLEDPSRPPAGSVRYYLVTGRDAAEGSTGLRSDGTPRPPILAACPPS